jgi:hypothetical protein
MIIALIAACRPDQWPKKDQIDGAAIFAFKQSGMTAGNQRNRYQELGLEGLRVELHPCRPRTYASWHNRVMG